MGLEIFPQNATLYPGDLQQFRFRTTPPPPLWGGLSNAVIEPDGSVSRASAGTFGALVIQRAQSGVATVSWTFDSDSLISSGVLTLRLQGAGSHTLKVEVGATSTTTKDENNNTVNTISHTLASGDVYKTEVAGNAFRLYINDTLVSTYTAVTSVRYPVRASFNTGAAAFVSSSPHVLAPVFGGNWSVEDGISSSSTNWAVAGGTLDDSTLTDVTNFTAGALPGIYILTATVESSSYQVATATIIIPPLSVLDSLAVTLQPGEKFTFKTNYDNAQSKIVTWSVVSGSGSFSNGEFTAPSAPGTTVVKAVYGNQEERVTITIPATMNSATSGGLSVTAAKLGEVLTLSTNMSGTINWTTDLGSLSASTGASVSWTAPNQSQLTARITATNGTYTITQEILVLKHFPYDPTAPVNWERKKTVLVSRAEDRSRASRVKDYNNAAFESFELKFNNRTVTEYNAAAAFLDDHYPGKRFIYIDNIRSIRRVVWADSDIGVQGEARCAINYSFRVVEG